MRCSGDTYEVKDPAIKLFGTIIRLPESDAPPNLHRISDAVFSEPQISDPADLCSGITAIEAKTICVQDSGNKDKSSISGDEKWEQTLNNKKDDTQLGINLQEDKRLTNNIREEKVLKKPDKIIPCPRCTSLETKFCYFNNYNVKQPRHFCRNCQRYWTAGGTMRKVAVGAGRRKNKQLATQFCQSPVPHAATQLATDPNIINYELVLGDKSLITLKTSAKNEKLHKFGSEKVLYESVQSLYPGNQSRHADIGSIVEIKEEPSQCVSSMTSIHEDETHEQLMGDEQGSLTLSYKSLMPQQALPCFPSSPWMSPWNPCWNSTSPLTVMSQLSSEPSHQSDDVHNQINWLPSPVMAVCRLGAPTIPMEFAPTPYWGLPYWPVNTSNIPLAESSSRSQTTSKHSRDEGFIEAEASKKRVIVPMTL